MDSETATQSGTTIEVEKTQQLKDLSHEQHPLVFNEDHSDSAIHCWACDDLISGETYSCAAEDCKYHRLHKKCEMTIQSGTIEVVERELFEDLFHAGYLPSLFFKEDQWDDSKEAALCLACKNPMFGGGECYSCGDDDWGFHLHKKCGGTPIIHINHLVCSDSQQHPLLALVLNEGFLARSCKLCRKEEPSKIKYTCSDCCAIYHIECVQFLLEYTKTFKHEAHPRPLLFFQNHTDLLHKVDCTACKKPLTGSIYISDDFTTFLHHTCASLPSEINLPCHRNHKAPLVLDFHEKTLLCTICHRQHSGYFYSCSLCNIDIHITCLSLLPSVIEDNKRHPHPFYLFWRQDPFFCDACGIEGGCASYVCFTCHIQVHPKCASLPPIIKITRHPHPVSHNYFTEEEEFEKPDCRICFREVKTKHGSYSCSKPDCNNYIVHVECAMENPRLYRVIDPDELSEDTEPIESSITCILEVNERGDAIKVKHFSHEHSLILGDEFSENDDKYCDGCVQSVTGKVYFCTECDFLLHKSCAELPRKKEHFFHEHLLDLQWDGVCFCHRCCQNFNGFVYRCEECGIYLCLSCGNIPDTVTHPNHKHLLFFDHKYKGQCTACGDEIPDADEYDWDENSYVYRCTKHCDFALDYKCITLPLAVRHKCDTHQLKFCPPDEKDDDETRCYCDICEERRHPNHWFYNCSVCDTSTHPKCVLGKYPLYKIGSKKESSDHPDHPLSFVQKIYYYPECAKCNKPCRDLSQECDACNYIIHWHSCP